MKIPKSGTQLVALAFAALLLQACGEPVAWRGTDVSGILPDLEFTLTGSDGLETGADAFHGKATLLYFGFTSCPGACPTTLNHVSVALDALGEPARNIHVLLVSVDPKRDTPEVMRKYTAGYGPWLHGLTGSEADLRAVNNAYKVDFLAQEPDAQGHYEVAHSNRLFGFDAQGRCRVLMPNSANTDAMVADLTQLLSVSGLAD